MEILDRYDIGYIEYAIIKNNDEIYRAEINDKRVKIISLTKSVYFMVDKNKLDNYKCIDNNNELLKYELTEDDIKQKNYYLGNLSNAEKKEYELEINRHRIYDNKDENYIDWDSYFMGIADLSSFRSKDPNSKVGACIVSEDNRILSIGYNGCPNGFDDKYMPWNREAECEVNRKYFYVVHAEANAILNYKGNKEDLKNATVYVNLFPCNECAKMIVQLGIKNIVYSSDKYNGTDGNQVAKILFDRCGVKYRKFDDKKKVKIIVPKK